jgi:glutamine---fructose-6-phosphate transaminase (isomerizing)
MCGIVGYIGKRDGVPMLMEGLRQLEYRGYDSAGIAVVRAGELRLAKCRGRVRDLEKLLARFQGCPGIAHTRWATHGEPSDDNAHPHCDTAGRIAVVHNGIIENAAAIRARLISEGVIFRSDTDTEVLPHLIAAMPPSSLVEAVRQALRLVTGTYAVAVLDAERPDAIVVARNGGPVVLGVGEHEMFIASDPTALVAHTRHVVHLDDGEIAAVRSDGFETSTLDEASPIAKTPSTITWTRDSLELGNFSHYMRKEIFEQPEVVSRTLRGRIESRFQTAHLGGIELTAHESLNIRRVKILGCGSAHIAGAIGAHLIEQLARVPAHAEPASEFRYRNPVIEHDSLYVAVSQSGETFETLAAIQEIKRKGGRVLGIVNVVGSTVARECGRGIYVHAGPEIAVVSTKTFTCTAVAFALLAIHLGRIRDLSTADGTRLLRALTALPEQIKSIIDREPEIEGIAERVLGCEHVYFIGRAAGYPVAMEGALKLKEVSYLHAEAYPASELKHGPLALITSETPTVVVVPHDHLFRKNLSTIEEIRARRGPVIAITDPGELPATAERMFVVPTTEPELSPLLLNIPLQLFAYNVAAKMGCDIDHPRNLAKAVTVE